MSIINTITQKPVARARLSNSVVVWLAVVAFMFAVKIVLTAFFPNALADPTQAALFDWLPLGIFAVLGLIGVLLSERTGFPPAWDVNMSNRRRLAFPILAGLAFGVAMVVFDYFTHFTRLLDAAHGVTEQYTGFLPMLLAFSVGAILVEVLYRLLPIPLLIWLISNLLLKGRWQSQIFLVLAVLTSALEFGQDVGALTGPVFVVHEAMLYALNFTQVTFFRKYGFLAAIITRAAFYLVWHALYVH